MQTQYLKKEGDSFECTILGSFEDTYKRFPVKGFTVLIGTEVKKFYPPGRFFSAIATLLNKKVRITRINDSYSPIHEANMIEIKVTIK